LKKGEYFILYNFIDFAFKSGLVLFGLSKDDTDVSTPVSNWNVQFSDVDFPN